MTKENAPTALLVCAKKKLSLQNLSQDHLLFSVEGIPVATALTAL